jgi:hypothetical protein
MGQERTESNRLILPSSYSSQISVTLDLGSKILFWTPLHLSGGPLFRAGFSIKGN